MPKTKIFGLGGFQEIGKSTMVVEDQDTIILVDSGIKFADASTTGLQGMIPSYQYLKNNYEKVQALVITHGHEDHIGGVIYLIQEIKIPLILAPKIAIEYLKYKIKDQGLKTKVQFKEVKKDDEYQFGSIKVDFWSAQHSIPHAFGVRLKTTNGSIMATGDFRFDYHPIGNYTDFTKLQKIGEEGLTVLLSDSTNAMRPHHSPSESDILKDIEAHIKEAKRKIIITGFASNLSRMKAIIELATRYEKKIAIFGRSMVNNINIAQKINFIENNSSIIDRKKIASYDENEILVLTTGSQGEELAALNRMSISKHAQIKIKHGDIIIFSSSPIPGNRQKIELLINRLYKLGALIKENGPDGYLHTSGHAYHDEHVKIFHLTRPKYFVPYHGDYRMCLAHGKTAIESGIAAQNVFYPQPGQVLYLKNKVLEMSDDMIDIGPVYIDGTKVLEIDNTLVSQRFNLGQNGFISVVLPINKATNTIVGRPKIVSKGSFLMKSAHDILEKASQLTHGAVLYLIKNNADWKIQDIKKIIVDRLQFFFYKEKRRQPIIIPSILFVDQKDDEVLSAYNNAEVQLEIQKKQAKKAKSAPKQVNKVVRTRSVLKKATSEVTKRRKPLTKEEILDNLRNLVFDLEKK